MLTDRKTVDGADHSKRTAAWDYLVKGERGRRDPPEGVTGPSLMPKVVSVGLQEFI